MFAKQAYDESGIGAMPNSDHPLLEQVENLRADVKNLDKQKRKAAKYFDTQRRILESRVETLVRKRETA